MTYNKKHSYCTYAPDGFFWWHWGKACYHHDRQYRNEVKKRLTRKQTDIKLREDMKKELPVLLHWLAWIYYLFVRLFSKRLWVK